MEHSRIPTEIKTDRYSSQTEVKMVLDAVKNQLGLLLSGQFELGIPHALKNKLYMLRMNTEEVSKLVDWHYVQEPEKE